MHKYLFILVVTLFAPSLRGQTVEDLSNKLKIQYRLWDFLGSIETARKLRTLEPKNKDSYYYEGLSKLYMGDFKGAEKDLKISGYRGTEPDDKALSFWLNKKKRQKYLLKFFYKGVKVYPEFGMRPKYTRKDSLRGALRPERTCYDVTFYNLKVKIMPRSRTISGTSGITFRVVNPTSKIQIDLFANYKIQSIVWDHTNLKYTREYNAIFVDFPQKLPVGSMQTVAVTYSGKPVKAPNPPWDGGFVWKKDKNKNWWCGVACEQLGASSWWPDKDHPSDEPDSALLTFTVPNGYNLVSNGRLRSVKPAGKGYTSHTWFVDNPINNYDITFYLGKFVHFSDTIYNPEGKYPLDYYVLPYDLEKAKKEFAQAKDVLKFYEKAFGPYPFMKDKYSLVEAPFAGMEHQSAIAYGSDFARNQQEYLNRKDDYIIVHETAHEWWGNSVTASDMADIWLQEGFATYSELMYLEHKYGYKEYLKQLSYKEAQIFNFWPVVQNYNVNENEFASNDCYNKGAAILNNLRCCIDNDSLFFKILRDFAMHYEKKIVTSRDFVTFVNKETQTDYTPFFKKFLYDKNLPVLDYTYKREGKNMLFTFQWTGVDSGFAMPFCISAGDTCFRLKGTTKPNSVKLINTSTFRFYDHWINPDHVAHDGYTYFWTQCVNDKKKITPVNQGN